MKQRTLIPQNCPCGKTLSYEACCGLYLDRGEVAQTAETLMRSRYTAYVLRREDYLLATWHATTRPGALALSDHQQNQWLGLTVKQHDPFAPNCAVVEFIARYKQNGKAYRLHERSRFVFEQGRWFYVDGDMLTGS